MLFAYNTLSTKKDKKEILRPRKNKIINLFVCGPTVYDFSHIGHARTYIVFDMIAKYLRQKGYKVFYLQNITDIEDKIIKRAHERGQTPLMLAREMEKEYLRDMKSLGINSVDKYARATNHIKEIISQVDRLLKKGYAYKTEDGVYYDISKFKNYGKLSGRTSQQAEDAVSRIDDSAEKRNRGDFALWKLSPSTSSGQVTADEPQWPSPWGRGRPGWHIEDTAITEKFFGLQYDIHGGARDLLFPHHEAEIAQMEAISGKKPMAKYWLHTGFLTVYGKKMAKSLNNFITIRDFLRDYGEYPYLRFYVLKSHYRSPIAFEKEFFASSRNDLEYIWEFVENVRNLKKQNYKAKDFFGKRLLQIKKDFWLAMDDDFNTPNAIGTLFQLFREGNELIHSGKLTSRNAVKILNFLEELDLFFNFILWEKPKSKIPSEVLELAAERERFRQQQNWQKADELRKTIQEMGYQLEDTATGPKIKPIKSETR